MIYKNMYRCFTVTKTTKNGSPLRTVHIRSLTRFSATPFNVSTRNPEQSPKTALTSHAKNSKSKHRKMQPKTEKRTKNGPLLTRMDHSRSPPNPQPHPPISQPQTPH